MLSNAHRRVGLASTPRRGPSGALAVILLAAMPADQALGADSPGFYAGASVGQSQVEANASGFATGDFKENHSAFKVMVGVRPISLVGAEFAYVDFGHPSGSFVGLPADVTMKGAVALGILYLPVAMLDIYAKAGFARIQSTVNGRLAGICTTPGNCGPLVFFRLDRMDTTFAAGAGAQLTFGSWALRAEYERFNAAGSSTGLASIGATWTFR